MLNSDIPKLFITNIKDTRFCYLIDGGHRARSINEYINNEFSIEHIMPNSSGWKGELDKDRTGNLIPIISKINRVYENETKISWI